MKAENLREVFYFFRGYHSNCQVNLIFSIGVKSMDR